MTTYKRYRNNQYDDGNDIVIYDDPFVIPEGLADEFDESDIERTEYEIYDKTPSKKKFIETPRIVEVEPADEYNDYIEEQPRTQYIIEEPGVRRANKLVMGYDDEPSFVIEKRPKEKTIILEAEDDYRPTKTKTYYTNELPPKKTYVIRDEKGRELSRIISAKKDQVVYEYQYQPPEEPTTVIQQVPVPVPVPVPVQTAPPPYYPYSSMPVVPVVVEQPEPESSPEPERRSRRLQIITEASSEEEEIEVRRPRTKRVSHNEK